MRLGARADGDVTGRHDGEGPVRTALVLEQSAEPGQRGGGGIRGDARGEVAPDDEVRALAQPDLVGDHPSHDRGVVVVGDVEPRPVQRDRGSGQLGKRLAPVDQGTFADDQAAQRRAVVMTLEAAFAHLAERHERQHLLRLARGILERDVGEQIHVDHVAGEQLDRRTLRAMSANGMPRSASSNSVASSCEGGSADPVIVGLSSWGRSPTKKTARRRSVVARTHRLGGGPPGGVRAHGPNVPHRPHRTMGGRPSPRGLPSAPAA